MIVLHGYYVALMKFPSFIVKVLTTKCVTFVVVCEKVVLIECKAKFGKTK